MKKGIRLSIGDIEFKEQQGKGWWRQTNYIEKVLELVKVSALLPFNYYNDGNSRYSEITDLELVTEHYKKNKKSSALVYICQEKDCLKDYLDIHLKEDAFSLTLDLSDDNDRVLEGLTKLFWQVYDLLKEVAYFGPMVMIGPFEYCYPRQRLMKDYEWLAEVSYINFIQPMFFENSEALKMYYEDGEYENLLTLDLPQGVTRIEKDGMYSIQWLESIEDEDAFKEAMMEREDWCYEHLELEPSVDCNEYGDGELFSVSALKDVSEEESFITHYFDAEFNKTYYQEAYAVCILENNRIPDEVEKKIKYYVKTKMCDSGAPIKHLNLITTTRERAVAINTQARRLGCYKVFYLDDCRYLWDLCPEGNWREPCPYDVEVEDV